MKLIIASNNEHKIKEIKTILANNFEEILSLKDVGIVCDPEETGVTFYENALIKAQEVSKHTEFAVIADDTGLCVDALSGAPGVNSARYAGNRDSAQNRKKLLQEMKGITNRSAKFETVVVLIEPNGKIITACGKVEGYILENEEGVNGFGYDCLFYSTELKKSFGNASEDEKNSVSHRSRALNNLLTILKHNKY